MGMLERRIIFILGIIACLGVGYASITFHTPIDDEYELRGVPENLGGGILHSDQDVGDDGDD